ncbi:hypothetical protein FZG53_11170 [Salmonella enterica]|nr:hypothetical protein [Salmonella enterica]
MEILCRHDYSLLITKFGGTTMLIASLSIESIVNSILDEQKAMQEQQEISSLPEKATDENTSPVSRHDASKILANTKMQAQFLSLRCREWRFEVEKVAGATRSDISDSDERLAYIADVMDDEANRMNTQLALMKLAYFRTSLSDAWKPYAREFKETGMEAIRACLEVRNTHRNLAKAIRMHINHNHEDYPVDITESEFKTYLEKADNFFSSLGGKA